MSYVKTVWETGDTITAEKLNNLENGVEQNAASVLKLTFTEDPNNEGVFVCNHTWQEIYDAINAGCYVTYIITDNFDEDTYVQNGISVVILTNAGHAEINDVAGYQSFYYIGSDYGADIRADSPNDYPVINSNA